MENVVLMSAVKLSGCIPNSCLSLYEPGDKVTGSVKMRSLTEPISLHNMFITTLILLFLTMVFGKSFI